MYRWYVVVLSMVCVLNVFGVVCAQELFPTRPANTGSDESSYQVHLRQAIASFNCRMAIALVKETIHNGEDPNQVYGFFYNEVDSVFNTFLRKLRSGTISHHEAQYEGRRLCKLFIAYHYVMWVCYGLRDMQFYGVVVFLIVVGTAIDGWLHMKRNV